MALLPKHYLPTSNCSLLGRMEEAGIFFVDSAKSAVSSNKLLVGQWWYRFSSVIRSNSRSVLAKLFLNRCAPSNFSASWNSRISLSLSAVSIFRQSLSVSGS